MPYCTVCKIETDFEYDIALSNAEYLHYSCVLMLQMRKREIETALRWQKSQFVLSLFGPTEVYQQDVISEAEKVYLFVVRRFIACLRKFY